MYTVTEPNNSFQFSSNVHVWHYFNIVSFECFQELQIEKQKHDELLKKYTEECKSSEGKVSTVSLIFPFLIQMMPVYLMDHIILLSLPAF